MPNASIKRRGDPSGAQAGEQTAVWLTDGKSLHLAPVCLGQSGLDGRVQVLDALKAGDRVVVYSEKELTADARIKIVDSLTARAP